MNVSHNPIALSFHESLLRVSDVQLLQGPHWLNDKIISFYFEYLEKIRYKAEPGMLFISAEVTQCIKMVNGDVNDFLEPSGAKVKPFIFFPLNDHHANTPGGSHWSLLVFSRPEKIFFHFDSNNNANYLRCKEFVAKTKYALECPGAALKAVRCLQQTNCYDCGIHVLCMADIIADHVNRFELIEGVPILHHDTISRKRGEILKIIAQLGGRIER